MKPFKFRHYDTRLKEMRYSESNPEEFYFTEEGFTYMYALPKREDRSETEYYKSNNLDMFTGMKDVNGKDIYQNDVVVDIDTDSSLVVKLSDSECCLYYATPDGPCYGRDKFSNVVVCSNKEK